MGKSRDQKVNEDLAAAWRAYMETVHAIAEREFNAVVKPYCNKAGCSFDHDDNTWYLRRLPGGDALLFAEEVPPRIMDILTTQVEGLGQDLGQLMPEYDPEGGIVAGDGGTIHFLTDWRAVTVIEVYKRDAHGQAKEIFVQRDRARRVDGNGRSEAQEYRIERDKSGNVYKFVRGKDGRWHGAQNRWLEFFPGERREYFDYSQ